MIIFVTFNLSSANAFNLVCSKVSSCGNGLKLGQVDTFKRVIKSRLVNVKVFLKELCPFSLKFLLKIKQPQLSFRVCMLCCYPQPKALLAKPHSSVSSLADLRTGGSWFDPRLGQYSFQGLMIVIATGFIHLSLLSIVSTMVMWESSQWDLKEYGVEYWLKELQECMDRYTGHHDIPEILLKTALNTIQSINQGCCPFVCLSVRICFFLSP